MKYEKYKDSGVEWIGNVPEHWEVMKMNYACDVITDFVASGSFADMKNNVTYLDEPDFAMLVRTADLSQKEKNIPKVYISKESYKFLSNSNLFGGEIILPNVGSVGDVYMVPKDLYEHMSLAPNSIMVKSKTMNKYMYYYFCSKVGRESLIITSRATTQGKFNKTELRALKIIIPPLPEQQAIANYLDAKCAKINDSIDVQKRKIELLNELKQTIITDAVTKGLNPNAPMKNSGIDWIGNVPEHWEMRKIKHIGVAENGLTYKPTDICDEEGVLVLRSSNIQNGKLTFDDNVYVNTAPISLKVKKGDIIICSRNGSASLVGKSAIVENDINATYNICIHAALPEFKINILG